ncbi:MAG: family 1 encapsulin nanocompartment shell protein [Fusobacterium sp. JB021]|nr:family 1 encapsulin nanocompartment shell protein [Fusobacterium sp. JB020]MDP0493948.1 family 1 encapsulin nanocompartment shell protein [Fusobacterium sp. JB021]
MNNLNKNMAPISNEAWEVLNERTKEILVKIISARKVVSIKNVGDLKSIPTGKINLKKVEDMEYGVYDVLPLIETRFNFTLNRWELDNISRGDNNINLTNLDKAIFKAAKFEEDLIYNGLDNVEGLINSCENPPMKIGETPKEILESISKAVIILKDKYISDKLDLIVNYDTWIKLNSIDSHIPLIKRIKELIKGEVIVSKFTPKTILIPHKNENFELSIGNDFSIGYQTHTSREVTLFITESFVFRILDKELFIILE